MSSRFRLIGLLGFVTVAGALLFLSFRSPVVVSQETVGTVSLKVDFGDDLQEWKRIPLVTGATAFSILKQEVERERMPLVYDPSTGAGVFVRQIGDKKNGDDGRYWQYWVQGKYAIVAADQQLLSSNDLVLWKFTNDAPTDY